MSPLLLRSLLSSSRIFTEHSSHPSHSDAQTELYYALLSAMINLDLATAMELLHRNPDVDYMPPDSRRTLLHMLASKASSDQVLLAMDILLQNQANVEARTPTGSTPLSVAVRYAGGLETAQYLLDKWNADVNARDNDGCTALYHAVVKQDPDLIRLLLDHGASPYMV